MGCLDHLFVHRGHQRRGIASALCDRLESLYPEKAVAVQASITVRGFLNGGATGPSLIPSLLHISEPTRQAENSYAVFFFEKKKKKQKDHCIVDVCILV